MSDQGSYLDIKPGEREPKGALIGTIIVIILLIVGAIYVLATKSTSNPEGDVATTTDEIPAAATSANVSALAEPTSTDLNDIEKDLKAMNSSTADAEFKNLSKDLGI